VKSAGVCVRVTGVAFSNTTFPVVVESRVGEAGNRNAETVAREPPEFVC
jgi:hypothetical protein